MRWLKIPFIILLAVIGLLAGVIAFQYYRMTPRERAEFWYAMQRRYTQGSAEEQWCLARSIRADPSYARAYMEKSISHNKRANYAEGFALLDQAVALAPIEYLGYRGYVKMYMLRDYPGALADWIQLDTLTPGYADAPWGDDIYYSLGLVRKQMGDFAGALREFDRSIAEITEDRGEEWVEVRTFLYRGITLAKLGREKEAVEAFSRGIFHFQAFTEAYYYRALSLQNLGRHEAACADLERALMYFDQGYIFTNAYYELPDQVYRSDILQARTAYCAGPGE